MDVAAGKSMIASYGLTRAARWLEGVTVSANPAGPAEVGLAFVVQDVINTRLIRKTNLWDENFIIFSSNPQTF
jgi:hypothetical protein